MTAEQAYLENLRSLIPWTTPKDQQATLESLLTWSKSDSDPARALHWVRDAIRPATCIGTADEVLARCRQDVEQGTSSIILVDNISPHLIGLLGVAFDIDPQCWLSYICSPDGFTAWDALFPDSSQANVDAIAELAGWHPEPTGRKPTVKCEAASNMGYTGQLSTLTVFAQSCGPLIESRWPRLQYYDQYTGSGLSTNITYFVVADTICIVLVDACIGQHITRRPYREPRWPMLRVPCSDDSAGLVIPHNQGDDMFSVFSIMALFLGDRSHRQVLLTRQSPRRLMDPITLAYYLSATMHRSNLKCIQWDIHRIAFKELQSESAGDLQSLSRDLHQQREEIVVLQSNLAHAVKFMYPVVRQYLARLPLDPSGEGPLTTFEEVRHGVTDVQRFLMDTFQLLTSTINIKDARLSIEQAARTTTLTQLAAIYLPLTLVTGIFGMNVREITNDDPSWWVCVVTLAFVGVFTFVLIWAQTAWKKHSSGIAHEVEVWVRLHHCGKRAWKWARKRWYNISKR